ncbi:MAG: ShlB/FhaC/HecB family hemolysin secretion/activation protein [Zoogloeaceae bacterium]|jgi:hemolysin activation/secretion protein|nr:ShlB/FhaC/HecB family hemolysin secretion/activation protein [Zoogloeaceae bacterium]
MRKASHAAWIAFFVFLAVCPPTQADIGTEEYLRHQERQRQLEERMTSGSDVRLRQDTPSAPEFRLADGETPCFPIHAVTLSGEESGRFRALLEDMLEEQGFVSGMCIGARGINLLMARLQDLIIRRGYVTTRVVAPAQSVKAGKLDFLLIPGKIRRIRFENVPDRDDWTGNAARTQFFRNEFPMQEGDLLNLRDIETALENFRRLQSVEASFEILPADTDQPGESDLLIRWKQGFPLRVTLSADDSGSTLTGKNQGTAVISVDNPLGLSDTFYAYYSHDLGHTKDINGHASGDRSLESGTKGYGFHYSAPFGNTSVAYSFNHNEYRQAVAGYSTNYLYWGWSSQHDLTLKRRLYRDGNRKTSVSLGAWIRSSRNYIDDAELTIQRRRMAGWHLALEHTEYLGNATVNAHLQYKRGTGAHRALNAPEEAFNEGTSRMRLVTGNIALSWPFRALNQTLAYSTQAHFQHNYTPLIAQDRLSIGNRYTVRGFDGEMTLMSERGSWWRNEFAWYFSPAHQIYLLWDSGHVSGPSTKWLAGSYLEGYGIGLRGQIKTAGTLHYDLFAARPAKYPKAFPVSHSVIGAAISYTF